MTVRIAKNLKRESSFINSNGEKITKEQFYGKDPRLNMGTVAGAKNGKSQEGNSNEDKKEA